MKTGLLWFDDDPRRQLEEKVRRAATHYERKYGQSPTLCFVHPSAFNGNGKRRVKRMGGVIELDPIDVAQVMSSVRGYQLELIDPVPGAHGWVLRLGEPTAGGQE